MKMALLDKEDINLIVVHWGMGATFPYIKASSNCRVVGAQVGILPPFMTVKNLYLERNLSRSCLRKSLKISNKQTFLCM